MYRLTGFTHVITYMSFKHCNAHDEHIKFDKFLKIVIRTD
jgi:hypothetical protein